MNRPTLFCGSAGWDVIRKSMRPTGAMHRVLVRVPLPIEFAE